MTRDTFAVVNSVTNWNFLVSPTPKCINEINFWKDNLATINGLPLWPVKRKPTKIVYSDASNWACESWIQFFHQNWSDLESSRSSEFRGLLAVSLSVQAFIDSLEAQTVVWYTDNQIIVRIANIGSKVPASQKTALHIHRCCLIRAISADQYYFVFLHVFMTTVLWKHGPEDLEMHPLGVSLLYSVTLRSCIYLFFSMGQRPLRCTLGVSACCIQLQLKVVDVCFPVRAKRPLWCTLGRSACCIQLGLKAVDFCFTVRARAP